MYDLLLYFACVIVTAFVVVGGVKIYFMSKELEEAYRLIDELDTQRDNLFKNCSELITANIELKVENSKLKHNIKAD